MSTQQDKRFNYRDLPTERQVILAERVAEFLALLLTQRMEAAQRGGPEVIARPDATRQSEN